MHLVPHKSCDGIAQPVTTSARDIVIGSFYIKRRSDELIGIENGKISPSVLRELVRYAAFLMEDRE